MYPLHKPPEHAIHYQDSLPRDAQVGAVDVGVANKYIVDIHQCKDRIALLLANARRCELLVASMFVQITITDSFDGAVKLASVADIGARRLTYCIRATDTIAQLGDDLFVVIFAGVRTTHDLLNTIDRVDCALAMPYNISGRNLEIKSAYRLRVYPRDAEDADGLLRVPSAMRLNTTECR